MKLVYIFLAFYYMLLTFIPCTDKQDKHEKLKNRVEKTASHQASDAHEHEDTCPPFCSCNCCGVSVAYLEINYFKIQIPRVLNPTIPVFDQGITSFFSHSIWQPPKNQFIS